MRSRNDKAEREVSRRGRKARREERKYERFISIRNVKNSLRVLLWTNGLRFPVSGSSVSRRLDIEQLGIAPLLCEQFFVCTDLEQAAAFEYKDPVGHTHCGKAMGDQHC